MEDNTTQQVQPVKPAAKKEKMHKTISISDDSSQNLPVNDGDSVYYRTDPLTSKFEDYDPYVNAVGQDALSVRNYAEDELGLNHIYTYETTNPAGSSTSSVYSVDDKYLQITSSDGGVVISWYDNSFISEELGLRLDLAEGWAGSSFDDRTKEDSIQSYGFEITDGTNKLSISTIAAGGRGSCFEDEGYTRTPHSVNNHCSTYEIVSLQKVLKLEDEQNVYVVGVKYTDGKKSEYLLSMYQTDDELKEGDILYGVYKIDEEFDSFHVTSTVEGDSVETLNSSGFNEIRSMLTSLQRI